jgi:hypothetical protein
MNCWQVARQIREQCIWKRPLIIAITGYGMDAARLDGFKLLWAFLHRRDCPHTTMDSVGPTDLRIDRGGQIQAGIGTLAMISWAEQRR